jgi:UDP-N-acetylmuramoyl-L-alanyl-D-glutamate--2,6-diaminopimelate ligase
MKLTTLLGDWLSSEDAAQVAGITVSGLALDSRKVTPGSLFIALAGSQQHGLAHLPQAISNGAAAVLFDPAELDRALPTAPSLPLLAITGLANKLGTIAAGFYGKPSSAMTVIGITGTNGKTSCSQFLSQLLDDCGIIGTLGWGDFGNLQTTINTTPDALSLQAMLAALQTQGKTAVAMEVSSHGLAQGRVNGIQFTGAVFTNISRDHLDYHGSMEAYLQAKLQLLQAPGLAFAAINLDDAYCPQILAAIPSDVRIYGFSRSGNSLANGETLSAKNLGYQADGSHLEFSWQGQQQTVTVPLYGDFNTENVAAVLTVLLALGGEFSACVAKLAKLKPVSGRMECFGGNSLPLVFVDYAHTPDALDKVLSSSRQHCQGQLAVVFGCGGNRDNGKRPLMRQAAERWADRIFVTDDNPRFETSENIISDILSGSSNTAINIIPNRKTAIETAIAQAAEFDCLVIAGKGHEDYQEINGIKTPFSDQQVVQQALAKRRTQHANAA